MAEKVWLCVEAQRCDIITDTAKIAEVLNCQHQRVVSRIESYVRMHPDDGSYFIPSQYERGNHRFYKMYSLTKEGLRIYLKLRFDDDGRNSPKAVAGLHELQKLLGEEIEPKKENPKTAAPSAGISIEEFLKQKIDSAGDGIEKLYQLYRDEANCIPDPDNIRTSEEKCENWVKKAIRPNGGNWFDMMELIYEYGDGRERNGYVAGFYMAFNIVMGLHAANAEMRKPPLNI